MMVYICTKFHENILNGIRVMERTRKVNQWTDGRTDRQIDRRMDEGHDIIGPIFDGRIKIAADILIFYFYLLKKIRLDVSSQSGFT